MQSLGGHGAHRAEWRDFEVMLDIAADETCRSSIRRVETMEVLASMDASSYAEAIEWAARWLEATGARAMIDGRPRSLVDFLRFTRIASPGPPS